MKLSNNIKNKIKNISLTLTGTVGSQILGALAVIGLSFVATGNWVLPMGLIAGYALAIGGQCLLAKDILKRSDLKTALKKGIPYGVAFVIFNIIMSTVNSLVATSIGAAATSANQVAMNELITQSPLLVLIAAGILGPICEELSFRGGFFNLFKNKNTGLIASSVLFGLIHFGGSTLLDLIFLPTYIISGLVFGYVYKKTDNIYLTSIMHIINNTFTILISLI